MPSSAPAEKLLKLRARDGEDIQVVSAVFQDAIVPLCDMIFEPKDQKFVLVAQRLRRENAGAIDRICCALTVNGVTGVQTQGVDLHASELILDLLAILYAAPDNGRAATLSLVFAGEARIRLDLGHWVVAVEDFGEPWPALCNPCHDAATSL